MAFLELANDQSIPIYLSILADLSDLGIDTTIINAGEERSVDREEDGAR